MTCVIVDAETLVGIASAATAAPTKRNFFTVHSPSAVEDPCRLPHVRHVVNDARVDGKVAGIAVMAAVRRCRGTLRVPSLACCGLLKLERGAADTATPRS